MDTTIHKTTQNSRTKSELEKFRLFYEFDTPAKEIHTQSKTVIRKGPNS